MNDRPWRIAICLALLVPAHASSQWGAGAPTEERDEEREDEADYVVAPAPPPAPPMEPYQPMEDPEVMIRAVTSFNLGVPLLLDTDRDVVRPGSSLDGRFTLTGRYLGGGFRGGFQWVPVELDATALAPLRNTRRSPLRRGFFGPFVHAQVPTPSGFTPYVQAGFDFNFWNFRETAVVCDFWYCYGSNVYRFTPGLHGRVGARFPVSVDRSLHLDLGLELGTSFPGNFFFERQPWVTPFFGVAHSN